MKAMRLLVLCALVASAYSMELCKNTYEDDDQTVDDDHLGSFRGDALTAVGCWEPDEGYVVDENESDMVDVPSLCEVSGDDDEATGDCEDDDSDTAKKYAKNGGGDPGTCTFSFGIAPCSDGDGEMVDTGSFDSSASAYANGGDWTTGAWTADCVDHCENGTQDEDEDDVDCGGADCDDCCENGKQDNGENGVDCFEDGDDQDGTKCDLCCENGQWDENEIAGEPDTVAHDTSAEVIDEGGAMEGCSLQVTCRDEIKNQGEKETDNEKMNKDCGGDNCDPCPRDAVCQVREKVEVSRNSGCDTSEHDLDDYDKETEFAKQDDDGVWVVYKYKYVDVGEVDERSEGDLHGWAGKYEWRSDHEGHDGEDNGDSCDSGGCDENYDQEGFNSGADDGELKDDLYEYVACGTCDAGYHLNPNDDLNGNYIGYDNDDYQSCWGCSVDGATKYHDNSYDDSSPPEADYECKPSECKTAGYWHEDNDTDDDDEDDECTQCDNWGDVVGTDGWSWDNVSGAEDDACDVACDGDKGMYVQDGDSEKCGQCSNWNHFGWWDGFEIPSDADGDETDCNVKACQPGYKLNEDDKPDDGDSSDCEECDHGYTPRVEDGEGNWSGTLGVASVDESCELTCELGYMLNDEADEADWECDECSWHATNPTWAKGTKEGSCDYSCMDGSWDSEFDEAGEGETGNCEPNECTYVFHNNMEEEADGEDEGGSTNTSSGSDITTGWCEDEEFYTTSVKKDTVHCDEHESDERRRLAEQEEDICMWTQTMCAENAFLYDQDTCWTCGWGRDGNAKWIGETFGDDSTDDNKDWDDDAAKAEEDYDGECTVQSKFTNDVIGFYWCQETDDDGGVKGGAQKKYSDDIEWDCNPKYGLSNNRSSEWVLDTETTDDQCDMTMVEHDVRWDCDGEDCTPMWMGTCGVTEGNSFDVATVDVMSADEYGRWGYMGGWYVIGYDSDPWDGQCWEDGFPSGDTDDRKDCQKHGRFECDEEDKCEWAPQDKYYGAPVDDACGKEFRTNKPTSSSGANLGDVEWYAFDSVDDCAANIASMVAHTASISQNSLDGTVDWYGDGFGGYLMWSITVKEGSDEDFTSDRLGGQEDGMIEGFEESLQSFHVALDQTAAIPDPVWSGRWTRTGVCPENNMYGGWCGDEAMFATKGRHDWGMDDEDGNHTTWTGDAWREDDEDRDCETDDDCTDEEIMMDDEAQVKAQGEACDAWYKDKADTMYQFCLDNATRLGTLAAAAKVNAAVGMDAMSVFTAMGADWMKLYDIANHKGDDGEFTFAAQLPNQEGIPWWHGRALSMIVFNPDNGETVKGMADELGLSDEFVAAIDAKMDEVKEEGGTTTGSTDSVDSPASVVYTVAALLVGAFFAL